jgi:hypothetical protein
VLSSACPVPLQKLQLLISLSLVVVCFMSITVAHHALRVKGLHEKRLEAVINLHNLPPLDRPRERLAAYHSAAEDEKRRVRAALAKAPKDRTDLDWTTIQYSPFGSASGCGY